MMISTSPKPQRSPKDGSSSSSSLPKEWFAGGVSNAFTSALLNPMDVTKTRLQVSKIQAGMTSTMYNIFMKEGLIKGLYMPGLTASVVREMLSSGPRAGFYVPLRDKIDSIFVSQRGGFFTKAIAAIITGTMGSIVANPVDVVKIRLMSDPLRYTSFLNALICVWQGEGMTGLTKGIVPSTLRGASIAVGELATYDYAKVVIKSHTYLEEGPVLHVLSSLITGLVATSVAAPFDVIKTLSMNSSLQKSTYSIFTSILKEKGFLFLFRGWLPSYLRLGPHALICFPLFEQLRKLLGLSHL